MDIDSIIGELIADPRYTYADHRLIADVAREVYAALTPKWTVQPTLDPATMPLNDRPLAYPNGVLIGGQP